MNFKNTAKPVSLKMERYLYKKGVKEERKRRDCLRYKYPKRKEKQLRPAFSLVEMLMALLVASLLLAALAPVMTRKFNDNINISANSTTQSKGWRLYTYSSDCNKAEDKYNVCEFKDFTVPKEVSFINLIMVSGGGGGAGYVADCPTGTYEFKGNSTTKAFCRLNIILDSLLTVQYQIMYPKELLE